MQHRGFAVATPGSQKSGDLDLISHRGCLQPAGRISHSDNKHFDRYQPLRTGFHLFRFVLENTFTHRNACGCVTQSLALNQQTGKLESIQPNVLYLNN